MAFQDQFPFKSISPATNVSPQDATSLPELSTNDDPLINISESVTNLPPSPTQNHAIDHTAPPAVAPILPPAIAQSFQSKHT